MRVVEREAVTAQPSPRTTSASDHGFQYIPALDGIRGLAVLAVLFFHGGRLTGGYLGVDAFFVLSGFLITSLLLEERVRSGRVGLAAFWTRRARRLLPALFVVLLAVAAYAAFAASSDDYDRIRGDALATLGYVANWHSIAQGHSYWELFQTPSPLEHTWSLAIEEQFYLVWPLLFVGVTALAAGRARRSNTARSIFWFSAALATVSATLMIALYNSKDPTRVYFGTDTRAAAILIGAALAAWVAWRGTVTGRSSRITLELTAIGAIVLLGVAWASLEGQSSRLYEGGFLVLGLAVAAVTAAAAHPRPGPVARALSFTPLRAVGIISYGLYLWHWPIYVLLSSDRTGLDGDALLATRLGASFAVATLSYVAVERPIRRGTLRGRRLVLSASSVAAVCAVSLVVATAGATTRDNTGFEAFVSKSRSNRTQPTEAPVTNPVVPRYVVLGDSLGDSIGRAAQTAQVDFGVSVQPGALACVFNGGTDGYQATLRDRIAVISSFTSCEKLWGSEVAAFDPQTAIVFFGTGAAFLDPSIHGEYVPPCDARYQRWYRRQLSSLLERFGRRGVHVYLAKVPYGAASWLRDDADARIDCVNAVHVRVARELENVQLLDLTTEICPGGRCPEQYQGAEFRPDDMHFAGASADYVARWMLARITQTP